MQKVNVLGLLILLILPSFVRGQHTTSTEDSTQLVGIPRWVHWRALHDLGLYRQCDSLLIKYRKENANNERIIDSLLNLNKQAKGIIAMGDSLDVVRTQQLSNDTELINIQIKEIDQWKGRTKISIGAAIGATFGGVVAGAPGAVVGMCIGVGVGWLAKLLL